MFRPQDHFIHQLTTLREDFICAFADRLVNLNIEFQAETQRRSFVKEDGIGREISEDDPVEYGLRTFIDPSLQMGI
jgi:hypothetical protein